MHINTYKHMHHKTTEHSTSLCLTVKKKTKQQKVKYKKRIKTQDSNRAVSCKVTNYCQTRCDKTAQLPTLRQVRVKKVVCHPVEGAEGVQLQQVSCCYRCSL